MAEPDVKPPRALAAIDRNLQLICETRAKAVETRERALRNAARSDATVMQCELHVALCDDRITELLDERLQAAGA